MPRRGSARTYRCPPDHSHDRSATCWGNHGCGCDACREAHRVRTARRRKLIAYGRWEGLVDPRRAALHVAVLRAGGWTVAQVAATAGVGRHSVSRLSNGSRDLVQARIANAILAVRYDTPPPGPYTAVDATGTVRRLQALVYMGWTSPQLAGMLACQPSHLNRMLTVTTVQERTRVAVAALYDRLWDQQPPANTSDRRGHIRRARTRAKKYGWVGPLAWDDDTIDAPDAAPEQEPAAQEADRLDETAVEAALQGEKPGLSPRERRAVIERLHHRNWSARRISTHIGCSPKTIERIRRELGLEVPDQMVIRDAA